MADALDAAFALFKAGRVPRQVQVDQRAEALQVQAFRGGIRADEQAQLAPANGVLQRVPAAPLEHAAAQHAGAVRASVDADGFVRQFVGELVGQPPDRIVELAEHDAAFGKPAVVPQQTQHGGALRVLLRVGFQRFGKALEQSAFFRRQRAELRRRVFVVLVVLRVLPAVQHPGDSEASGDHRAADAPQQHCAEEPGVQTFGEQLAECFGLLVGVAQERWQGDGVSVAVSMQANADAGEVWFASFGIQRVLQVFPRAQHDGADVGVVAFQKAREDVAHAVSVRWPERLHGIARRVGLGVFELKRPPQNLEIAPFLGWRKGIAQPVPAFVEVRWRFVLAEQHRQRLRRVAPRAARHAQHGWRAFRESVEQVVCLHRMQLHRRCGGEQQALCARRDRAQEAQQVVRFGGGVGPLADAATTRPVRFVQDDALETHGFEMRHDIGVTGDGAGGDDADAPRAVADGFGADAGMLDAAFVQPQPPRPNRRRQPKQRLHLFLPLAQERLRRQHQHGLLAGQGHELRRHRQLQRLAEAHLIRQHEARPERPAMGVEGQLHEVLLVFPQAHFPPIDGRFHYYRGRFGFVAPALDFADEFAAGEPIQVLHHEVRERHRERRLPQRIELRLHPRDGLRRVVFPDQLVVEAKGRLGFVGAAEKRRALAVDQGDDAGLAVDQAEDVVRQHAHLQFAGAQKVVEALEARPCVLAKRFRAGFAPLAAHGRLGELRDVHVRTGELRVADDADLALDGLQRLASDFEDRGGKVAGDAVVAPGVAEAGGEERRVEGLAAGGVALDQRLGHKGFRIGRTVRARGLPQSDGELCILCDEIRLRAIVTLHAVNDEAVNAQARLLRAPVIPHYIP